MRGETLSAEKLRCCSELQFQSATPFQERELSHRDDTALTRLVVFTNGCGS